MTSSSGNRGSKVPTLRGLRSQVDALRARIEEREAALRRREDHHRDPVDYATRVLGVELTDLQRQIARAVAGLAADGRRKVMAKACHSVGKTYLMAVLTCWWFDTYRDSSAVITTAPTHRDVVDLLWREVRLLRGRAARGPLGGFTGLRAPELWDNEDHFAKGFTADRFFQGRHLRHMLFLFDEAIGVPAPIWEQTKSMFKPGTEHSWFVIGNPTDTSSTMYQEELSGDWQLFEMSAPEHPNIRAELRGRPPPYPSAVSLAQFEGWVRDWCDALPPAEALATDLEWPPGSGVFYRPGPEMEARGLGRWPSQATYGVWSDAAWRAALVGGKRFTPGGLPQIGCDVARFGDDFTAVVVRWGPCALHHERHNGWSAPQTVGRLKELAREWAARATAARGPSAAPVTPQQIKVKIDADGMGGLGIVDWADGYQFVGVSAGTSADNPDRYPNKRSELWFAVAERAQRGLLDLSGLGKESLARLRRQALAPVWKLDAAGRRVVESKSETKKRLGAGSPDDMDALNLSYHESIFLGVPSCGEEGRPRREGRERYYHGPADGGGY
jgi:hypothetical protein